MATLGIAWLVTLASHRKFSAPPHSPSLSLLHILLIPDEAGTRGQTFREYMFVRPFSAARSRTHERIQRRPIHASAAGRPAGHSRRKKIKASTDTVNAMRLSRVSQRLYGFCLLFFSFFSFFLLRLRQGEGAGCVRCAHTDNIHIYTPFNEQLVQPPQRVCQCQFLLARWLIVTSAAVSDTRRALARSCCLSSPPPLPVSQAIFQPHSSVWGRLVWFERPEHASSLHPSIPPSICLSGDCQAEPSRGSTTTRPRKQSPDAKHRRWEK